MRGGGHRILIDTGSGCEEAGYEVAAGITARGDDETARVQGGYRRQIGDQRADDLRGLEFREQVEPSARRLARGNTKCCNEF